MLLAGCEASLSKEEVPRVDIQEMNVSFDFHESLMLRASQNEAMLSGPTTRMQVHTLPYAAKQPAIGYQLPMWALPKTIADDVRDERSCGPLKSAKVFLPVDTSLAMRCDLVMDPSGRPVVWMVGIGRPFEAAPFLQSSFMVLEEDQYHLFSYVHPFPEADATARWLRETFKERNPNMSGLVWPNRSFLLLIEETKQALASQINPPSDEVQAVMDQLRGLAFSVGPSRALQGQ